MKLLSLDPNIGYIGTHLYIPKSAINVDGVKKTLTFEIFDQESVRLLYLFEEAPDHLIVPRSLWKLESFPHIEFIDIRPTTYTRTGIKSRIKLDHKPVNGVLAPTGKTVQRDSLAAITGREGTLQLKCGAGKTVVALELAARAQVPTLILVDNTQLLEQWLEMIEIHLTVPGGVGIIRGAKRDWRKSIVVGTYQTVAGWADEMPEEVRRWFGLVIPDEGHHISAPFFAKSAPLFYGQRLALSATPNRADGAHVVCLYHVGPVLFKDVFQETPPAITFKWTGVTLDLEDVKVKAAVNDSSGEMHLQKLAGYLGSRRDRLENCLIPEFRKAVEEGRKVLVLSHSVAEVVNLMALWGGYGDELYSEVPYPTAAELGHTEEPVELTKRRLLELKILERDITRNLSSNGDLLETKRRNYEATLQDCRLRLYRQRIFEACEREHSKRLKAYLKVLLAKPNTAGLFTFGVKPKERMRMLKERRIIFAIMKYGKEGLDDKHLDTVFMCEPVSDRNMIQQIMGRPRDKGNAKLVIFEDEIGPLLGQCMKMRKHFREWSADEGGPFKYTLDGHPSTMRGRVIRPHIQIPT